MPTTLTNAVRSAMLEAADKAIMPRFRALAALEIADKGGGEIVTVADRESEAILTERLANLIPGATVIGEEAVHADPSLLDRAGSGTCWIVDPLDGTGNFAAGRGPFGILVALAQDGTPVGGWILDPVSGRLCSAERGQGAWIGPERFTPSPEARKRPVVAITKLFSDPVRRAALLAKLGTDCDVVDSPRCAADQYPCVALGRNDATLFTRTLAWDHAAGVVFLNEAGGQAARPDGSAYRVDDNRRGMIVAMTPALWDRMARWLAGFDPGALSA